MAQKSYTLAVYTVYTYKAYTKERIFLPIGIMVTTVATKPITYYKKCLR